MNAYSAAVSTGVSALSFLMVSHKGHWDVLGKARIKFCSAFYQYVHSAVTRMSDLDLPEPCGSFLLKLAMLVGA